MEAVFIRFLNMSIAASWLILAVVLLRVILKKAPKSIRRILWALVGIRLVLPFSPESFLSLIPSAETVSPDILRGETPHIHSGISAFNTYINPVISESFVPVADANVHPMQIAASIASIVWIAGMALLVLYGVISYVGLRRKVAEAVPLRDNLWQGQAVASPFVLGFFRPRIYLPFGMDEESIVFVVAHENEHISRRDHWIKPIGFLLLVIYWFNPLIWLAYILLCRDIELACDERVVKRMSADDKKAYSKALLTCSVDRRSIAACPLAFGEVGVKQRITNVLNYKKPTFWIIIAALVSCAVVAVCFLTNPRTDEDPAEVVGEYDTSSLGGAFVTSGNPAYKIGMNAYGMPVFVDTDAAFDAILEDCADGFAYLAEAFNHPVITKNNYEWYKTHGWQTDAGDKAVREQCEEISRFFDIYENSFSPNRSAAVPPTAEGTCVYTGGALLGQSLMLSSLGPGGSYYMQIVLADDALTVINDRGETFFESSRSTTEQISRSELMSRLEKVSFGWNQGYGVPEYDSPDDMAVYSYYNEDDPENVACSVYWFGGEPIWFAVGGVLRIYELEPASPITVYSSQSCVYMNPLSSVYPYGYPYGDSGYRYLMGEDRFTIVDKGTGEASESFTDIDWDWQAVSESEWKALFSVDIMAPDISGYENPMLLKLSSRYYLFNMDGELWLGQNNGGKVGMWSIYSLARTEAADEHAIGGDTPESVVLPDTQPWLGVPPKTDWPTRDMTFDRITFGSDRDLIIYRFGREPDSENALADGSKVLTYHEPPVKRNGEDMPGTETDVTFYLNETGGVYRIDVYGSCEMTGRESSDGTLAGVLTQYGGPNAVENDGDTYILWYYSPEDSNKQMWFEVKDGELTKRMGIVCPSGQSESTSPPENGPPESGTGQAVLQPTGAANDGTGSQDAAKNGDAAAEADKNSARVYPVNKYDQTYTNDFNARRIADWQNAADLIGVNQNGIYGYCRREDFYQAEINKPSSPDDKAEWNAYYERYKNNYDIPVYDVNGETVLGYYTKAPVRKKIPVSEFPVNEYGETYGSLAYVNVPGGRPFSLENYPNLIAVAQSVEGYVRREDYFESTINIPNSPDDKEGWERYHKLYGNKEAREIPVYEVDGRTVVGTFTIGGGYGPDDIDVDVSGLTREEAFNAIREAVEAGEYED
jgi:beta-lactamase regulating signal transducer with metallopeptidase domain